MKKFNTGTIWLTAFLTYTVFAGSFSLAEPDELESVYQDTLLMFVGEQLETLSIASRREESASKAPAIAQVINRKEFQDIGADTLSQMLVFVPGFHMAKKEYGTRPYLRGIPDSILLLYDTVPLGSDVSKSYHPMDDDLSLASVKRIEIIRGTGSVLWGPDAFAGIVNIAPMTGKDLNGAETSVRYGTQGSDLSAYANIGYETGLWDFFMSVSARSKDEEESFGNVVRFWGNGDLPAPPEVRFGKTDAGQSEYSEISARIAYGNAIALSARLSDSEKPFIISDSEENLAWKEERRTTSRFIKLEGKKELDLYSAVRFAGAFTSLTPDSLLIDLPIDQKENMAYGEIIYDRSLFSGQGLFTGGVSYREKNIKNAPIWDSYLPEYLGEDNLFFLPTMTLSDYQTKLYSVFGQYHHKIGNMNLWFGSRYDNHNEYQDHVSLNAGAAWNGYQGWLVKLAGGTAYRTPFSRQLIEDEKPELEKIESLSLQLKWTPAAYVSAGITGFLSRIDNHIIEDPYAGLSEPNTQDFSGLEFELTAMPVKSLMVSANLTSITDNGGEDEQYRYNDYTYIKPDGTVIKHYQDIHYPYDGGADTLFNLTASWKPHDNCHLNFRLRYFGSSLIVFPRGENFIETPSVWLADATATFHDLLFPGLDLTLSLTNLADCRYEIPGTYHPIKGDPAELTIMLRKKW